VITPEVGGGFGSKLNVYAEEALAGYLAIALGNRSSGSNHRREISRLRFTAATRLTTSKWLSSATARFSVCAFM